jgi:hypothetical protein
VSVAVGVVAREVEEVYTGEDDEETTKERNRVYGGRSVKALEEEEGCDECAGGEGYVVKWVDTVRY